MPAWRFLSMLFVWVALSCGRFPQAAAESNFPSVVTPFLTKYCFACHGADKQSGDRRFDALSGAITDENSLADLQDILDQLNLDEMPPADAEQPSVEEQRRVIQWLTTAIAEYHGGRAEAGGQTVLRRLNAREYGNVVRDLLHLNMTMFDPTTEFPRDQTHEHLDNLGATLVTSGHLLGKYLAAADRIVNKAMLPQKQPPVQTWNFRDGFRQQPEIDQVHGKTNSFSHLTLYDVVGADKHEGAYAPIHAFAQGVPYDGYYEIGFDADALHRLHPYDDDFLGTDRNELLRLGIVAGNRQAGPLHKPQPMEPLLAEIELADGRQRYTARVWLDQGFTPRFTFRNGLMDARNLWSQIIKKYPDKFPKLTKGGIVEARYTAIKYGELPQIHIDNVEIKGPFYDRWPTDSQRALLGDDWEAVVDSQQLSQAQMREHLAAFATRAYRRPATDDEVERLMQLIAVRQAAGQSPIDAFADGIKAVLCSPNFLYVDETAAEPSDAYALASRLSLFLWSSLPDEQLNQLAKTGQLQQTSVLREQVERMLDDPKSDALVSGFLGSWLTLRDLGSSPPDRNDFRAFYHYDLGHAMLQETLLFARYLIDENLSILNFVDSDFTFVNKPLARHYGIQTPAGVGFERVSLTDRRRGGLLGQASVLTVTANGIDTSPVVRGVWLLENILGTPPSPPPPDVEPLDPDVRGATTIRDQLSKHRTIPSCNDCHRKIDPLGFALENFDAIGKWREKYSKSAKIDPSGELPNGKSFENIVGLKQILLEQQDFFARATAEKLLSYALGRLSVASDRPYIDQILSRAKASDYGFRDLIIQVVLSEPFLTN